jgi:hypothetical protein
VAKNVSSTKLRPSEVINVIQLVSPMVQAAVEAIPVAGSPLKAAIGSLLQIIQITDVGRFSYFMVLHSYHRTTDKESKQGSS